MQAVEERVASHYTREDLYDAILAALEKAGQPVETVSIDDLAPVDEYHIRGREATKELLSRLSIDEHTRVLDVGCGIGGACRLIAAEYGARATGLDLSAEYCRVAEALSEKVGLGEKTTFERGSALATPFADGAFDVVLSQHVQMNVSDKEAYARELARVLRPGGILGIYEICAGPGGATHFPVPWAEDASISFLVPPERLRALLEAAGLELVRWRDVTTGGHAWFEKVLERVKREGPPPVGLHLLMGAGAPEKMQNVLRNLAEERIVVVQGLFRKALAGASRNAADDEQ